MPFYLGDLVTRMGKQEFAIMSGRVGIHEISLQNLYVDTGALRVNTCTSIITL